METIDQLREGLLASRKRWRALALVSHVNLKTIYRVALGITLNPTYSTFNRLRHALREVTR